MILKISYINIPLLLSFFIKTVYRNYGFLARAEGRGAEYMLRQDALRTAAYVRQSLAILSKSV